MASWDGKGQISFCSWVVVVARLGEAEAKKKNALDQTGLNGLVRDKGKTGDVLEWIS